MFDFDAETIKQCAYYTGVVAIFTIVTSYSWSFQPVAAFRAAGDTKYALILSVTSMFVWRVGLAYVLAYYFDMELMAVWIAMATDWLCRVLFNTWRFKSNKWLDKKVI